MVKPEANYCDAIARKFKVSSQSVDHAMTNAIRRAFAISSIDDLQKLYTAKINPNKTYPTYSEFVYYYARKIKNDL